MECQLLLLKGVFYLATKPWCLDITNNETEHTILYLHFFLSDQFCLFLVYLITLSVSQIM
jgi:hypothetical protein